MDIMDHEFLDKLNELKFALFSFEAKPQKKKTKEIRLLLDQLCSLKIDFKKYIIAEIDNRALSKKPNFDE